MFQNSPTVFIVDADADFRSGIRQLVRAQGIACEDYASATSFVADYDPSRPGCALLDLDIPGMHGVGLIDWLHEKGVQLPFVALSSGGTVVMAVYSMRQGAVDFLEKPVNPEAVLSSIRRGFQLDHENRCRASAERDVNERLANLTPREIELLSLLVEGNSNKQIALKLGIGQKTVENHRASVMRKTGATNTADLVRISVQATRLQLRAA